MDHLLFLLQILICVFPSVGAQSCPNEWTSYDGSCYRIGTERLSWADAEEWCQIFDASLASVETQRENDFIKKLLTEHHPSTRVWLGATDIFNKGHFQWLRTFQAVSFSDWSAGEPNHYSGTNSEDCVQMRGDHHWQWNDAACAERNYFICEINLGTGNGIIG